jgi:hypothetical protein
VLEEARHDLRGHLDPEVHARVARRDAVAAMLQRAGQELALAPIRLARARDVLLVLPGDDRRALHELLRRRPHRRPEGLERRDHLRRSRDEARAIPRHRGALGERLERDDVAPVANLKRRDRRLVEPELAVRLVGGDGEVVSGRQLRQPLVEAERGGRAGRVVRGVDPEDRRPPPRLLVHVVERR